MSLCPQFGVPGNDNYNLSEAPVCFENEGIAPASMTDWHVRDAFGHTYGFPTLSLLPRARVKVRTGCGANTLTDLH